MSAKRAQSSNTAPAPAPVDAGQAIPDAFEQEEVFGYETEQDVEDRDALPEYGIDEDDEGDDETEAGSDDVSEPEGGDDSPDNEQDSEDVEDAPPAEDAAPEGEGDQEPLSREDFEDYGFTREQAEAMDKAGLLESVLGQLDTNLVNLGRRETPPEGDGGSEENPTKEAPNPEVPGEFKLELDPEEFEPAFIEKMGGLVDHFTGRISQLEGHLAKVHESLQQREWDSYIEGFDNWVNSLPAEYDSVFGKGTAAELGDSGQMAKRRELLETVNALGDAFTKAGRPPLSESALREKALRVVAGDHIQTIVRKQVEAKARNAKEQFISRPTQREGKPGTPEERAVRFAEGFMKDRGVDGDS